MIKSKHTDIHRVNRIAMGKVEHELKRSQNVAVNMNNEQFFKLFKEARWCKHISGSLPQCR